MPPVPALLLAVSAFAQGSGDAPHVATIGMSKSQLKAQLLSSYGLPSIRPSEKAAEANADGQCIDNQISPEDVEVQIYVDQFEPLDMLGQTYGFSGYLRAWWSDPQLAYAGRQDGGCTDELSFTPDEHQKFWRPRFYWEDAKAIQFPGPSDGELFIAYPSGDVWWSRQVSFTLNCPFAKGSKLDTLPFDTQTCAYKMGMYAETAAEVRVRWKPARVALANWQGVCMAEWSTTKLVQQDMVDVYSSANYTYTHFALDFSRYPSSWIWSYLVPAVVTVALSYLGFYIDPAATPARVALGMLCLLFNINNFAAMLRALPPTASPPWLTRFVLNSFFFNVAAMVEQIIVSFGNSAHKWLENQRADLEVYLPWRQALVMQRAALSELLIEWDTNHSGDISKAEFRRGVKGVGIRAPLHEINHFFETLDTDGDGQISLAEMEHALSEEGFVMGRVHVSTGKLPIPSTSSNPQGPTAGAPRNGSNQLAHELALEKNMNAEGDGQVHIEVPNDTNKASAADTPPPPPRSLTAIAAKAVGGTPPSAVRPTACFATPSGGAAAGYPQSSAAGGEQLTASAQAASWSAAESAAVGAKSPAAFLKARYRERARIDMDKDAVWGFKTFNLFPFITRVRNLDHICRWFYPIVYVVYVLTSFSEVGFGAAHYQLLLETECYQLAAGGQS